jgi:hypothetical protein
MRRINLHRIIGSWLGAPLRLPYFPSLDSSELGTGLVLGYSKVHR